MPFLSWTCTGSSRLAIRYFTADGHCPTVAQVAQGTNQATSVQEIGPFAALLCFREVLKPPEVNVLADTSRLDKVAIARLDIQQSPGLQNADDW